MSSILPISSLHVVASLSLSLLYLKVYIHCDLLVCRATTGNESSECDTACVGNSGNRARRDVGENSLHLKRIMKGPLRLRRSAHIHPSLDNKLDSKGKSFFLLFNGFKTIFLFLSGTLVTIPPTSISEPDSLL